MGAFMIEQKANEISSINTVKAKPMSLQSGKRYCDAATKHTTVLFAGMVVKASKSVLDGERLLKISIQTWGLDRLKSIPLTESKTSCIILAVIVKNASEESGNLTVVGLLQQNRLITLRKTVLSSLKAKDTLLPNGAGC